MFKYFVIVLVFFVTQCDTKCEEKDGIMNCGSVYDVKKLKQQRNWTKIIIRSTERQRITEYTFAKTPNVTRIEFLNAVKDIEEFTFYDLSSLKYLEFHNCDLPIIKRHWFNDVSSISWLSIKFSNVKSLESRCFQGTPNLTSVIIQNNHISHIPGNVFNGTSIRFLNLGGNQIQFIQDNAFINMSRLEYIRLSYNLLKSFNPKVIIANGGLSNLKNLNLAKNQIEIIPSGAFNSFVNLVELNISCNKLKAFPESAFPFTGLPFLEQLYLANNRLNYMSRSFIRYLPKLKDMSIFGNPWQCACYKNIINSILLHNVYIVFAKDFLNGTRPVCVVLQTGSDKCLNNIQIPNDLYDYFAQETYHPC